MLQDFRFCATLDGMVTFLERVLQWTAADAARNREVRQAWEVELLPLQEIADRHGISRERVRQILEQMGAITSAEQKKLKRESEIAHMRTVEEDFRRQAIELLKNSVGRADALEDLKRNFPELTRSQVEKMYRATGLVALKERATPDRFSDDQLRLAVYMCFGLQYELALSNQDYSSFVNRGIRDAVESLAREEIFPKIISLGLALNAIGFFFSKLGEGGLDPFPHKSYERVRKQIWEANDWGGESGGVRWPPTQQTISKRLGGGYWSDATDLLGFPASEKSGRARGGAASNPKLVWDALNRFVAYSIEEELSPSVKNFESWRQASSQTDQIIPSSATVRKVVGSWSSAINSVKLRGQPTATLSLDSYQREMEAPSFCVHGIRTTDCAMCCKPPDGTPNQLYVHYYGRHYHAVNDCSALMQQSHELLADGRPAIAPVEIFWAEVPENFAPCRTCLPTETTI